MDPFATVLRLQWNFSLYEKGMINFVTLCHSLDQRTSNLKYNLFEAIIE